jgi:hypothetical protein
MPGYVRFDGIEGVRVAYRYENHVVSAGVDEFDNPLGPGYTQIYCHEYEILSDTPKGFWIRYWPNPNGKRFILKDAKKCFVHLTQREALEAFVRRKYRQISILNRRIGHAEAAIRLAKIKLDTSAPAGL